MKTGTMIKATLVSTLALATAFSPSLAAAKEAAAPVEIQLLPETAAAVSYDISIDPDFEARTFKGAATLHFDVNKSTKEIVVNSLDIEIARAVLDGKTEAEVILDAEAQTATFRFPKNIRKGRHSIAVDYTGKIFDQAFGLFASVYPDEDIEKTALVTQLQPGDARRVAPMWDEPAQKAVFNVTLTAPEGMSAYSNMPATETTTLDDGRTRTSFAPSPKMSSYLLFLGIGEFDRIAATHENVELGIVTRAGETEKGGYALDATKDIISYMNDYFATDYPLPKLDQLAVPGAGGFAAMENWGAILYFEPVLLFDPETGTPANKQYIYGVVAHEVAHQWFGNLVTMNWWDDLWLNEGFASWMSNKVTRDLKPEWDTDLSAASTRDFAMRIDSVITTHPVVMPVKSVDEATLYFDAIAYSKGQSIIAMFESYLGDDAFKAGIQEYMRRHAYGNTVTNDLWQALEDASDQPVVDIANSFTRQPGVPLITVDSISCDNNISTIGLRQTRFGSDAESKSQTLDWVVPVTASVLGSDAISRTTISGAGAQMLEAAGCGPVKLNAGEGGYYRTLYSDDAFSDLASNYEDLSEVDQLGLANDAYALATSGYAPFGRLMTLVEATSSDANPVLVANIASDLGRLRNYYKGEPGFDAFSAYAVNWMKPVFARVGWEKAEGEADNVTNLRNGVLGALANYGDKAVISEARRRYAAFKKDPDSLSPELRTTVIRIVASKADEKTFDEILAKGLEARNPRDQRLYLGALAGIEDEALARRAIDIFLSDQTPAQLRARLFGSLAGEHPRLIWDYYRENYERIDALLDPLGRLSFGAGIASSSYDAAVADELEAFAAEHLPPDAKSAVDRAASGIRFNAGVKKERIPELTEWLEAR